MWGTRGRGWEVQDGAGRGKHGLKQILTLTFA